MIYTSYFGNVKRIKEEKPELKIIGISLYECKFVNCDYEKNLAPTYSMLWNFKNGLIDWKEYCLKFYDMLYDLDYRYLNNFQKTFDGYVLCCYEKSDERCHRKLVRKFLKWWNGTEIIEYV